MNNKLHSNVFESGFESFEFDDGFLSKVDAEIKSKGNRLESLDFGTQNTRGIADKKNEEIVDKNKQYYNLSIDIGDLNDSDFLDFDSKIGENIFKVKKECDSLNNAFIAALSPIHGAASSKSLNQSFSSTPLRKEPIKIVKKSPEKDSPNVEHQNNQVSQSVLEKKNLKEDDEDDLITISQAFKLLEEAESAEKTINEDEHLNKSIDLLTGEVVGNVADLFSEPFNSSKLESNKKELKNLVVEETIYESSDDSVIEIDAKISHKPAAAQKLKFCCETDKLDYKNDESDLQSINFESDNDFEVLTQVCAEPKVLTLDEKSPSPVLTRTRKSVPLKDSCELEVSDCSIIDNKKRKCRRIIESDSASDSSSFEFEIQRKKKTKRTSRKFQGREYIDSEAEVSEEIEVSSDEVDEEGEYEKSFLDEESYLTQNQSANMTAKYLESVKGVSSRPGAFKIPKAKPYNPVNVFSQMPDDTNTEYELDSFCVNEVDEEMKTDLSDLEIAEKIIEMDRKKRKKKRWHPSRRAH